MNKEILNKAEKIALQNAKIYDNEFSTNIKNDSFQECLDSSMEMANYMKEYFYQKAEKWFEEYNKILN